MTKSSVSRQLSWAKHQKRWFGKWHLYLGIIAGAIIAVVGLTGSILVFQDEIDVTLNPEIFRVQATKPKIPLGELVELVRQRHPSLKFDYITLGKPENPNLAYSFLNYKGLQETFINPYTGDICGKRIYNSGFIGVVTKIHTSLLIPPFGKYIVGLAALCLLILTISGLRLWIPKKWRMLKAASSVKWNGNFKRKNYDLHSVIGLYSAPVVSVLAITGFCITFSTPIIAMLFMLSGRSPQNVAQLLGAKSKPVPAHMVLPMSQIVKRIGEYIPDARVVRVGFPGDSTGSYRVDLASGTIPISGKRDMLLLDQYSGGALLNSQRDFPPIGKAYLSWLTPLHYGAFGGLGTRVIALLAGLVPLLLFITGWFIWWPRFKKQGKSQRQTSIHVAHRISRQRGLEEKKEANERDSLFLYFLLHAKDGFKYGLISLILSLAFGAIYGLISLIVIQPALFMMALSAIIVFLNFVIATVVEFVNLLFLLPLKKGSRTITKYFALSLSFAVVFALGYLLIYFIGEFVFF